MKILHGNFTKHENTYRKNSVIVSTINAWNNSQKFLKIPLKHLPSNKMKKFL